MVYITRGCGTLRYSDQIYSLNEGSAFILRPEDSHWYAPDDSTGWGEYWVGFQGSHIEDLFHLKINLSKELLQKPDLTVKEVAYQLDFRDPFHFSKLFKSKTGVSPSQ